jgi:hypothetical protein
LICDLGEVWKVDSRGIRALVRGHTTAQRLGGSFKIANPHQQVRSILELSGLDRVLGIYETVGAARRRIWPWKEIVIVAVAILGTTLVLADIDWNSGIVESTVRHCRPVRAPTRPRKPRWSWSQGALRRIH